MTGEGPGVPFPTMYWVVPGEFLAGGLPSAPDAAGVAQRMQGLLGAGIRCIISLIERSEITPGGPYLPYEEAWLAVGRAGGETVEVRAFPIRDFGVPPAARLEEILEAVDACRAAGRPLYLHCWGGVGRTGTVVGAWLARHGLATGAAVLSRLAELRRGLPNADRPSPETEAQRVLVTTWPARAAGRMS